jgi:hypothetical protein
METMTVKAKNAEDQPLWDALPSLVTRAQLFLDNLFGAGKYKVIGSETDTLCDPQIEIDGYGIGVSIMWGEQPSIVGSKPRIEYGAYEDVFIPGRRYYPDGSGQPDDSDVHELGDASPYMDTSLVEMLKGLVQYEVSAFKEHEADEAEAEWLEEEEQYDAHFNDTR